MSAMYEPFADYYDLEYGHKDDDILFYMEEAARYGSPILEIGSGTGRISLRLAEAGHRVWGLDNSARMLAIAERKRAHHDLTSLTLVRDDMRRFSLDERFQLCIIPFRTFLHNLCIRDQLATLRAIRTHLLPQGHLILDLFVPLYHVLAQNEWCEEIEGDELSTPDPEVRITTRVSHQPEKQLLTICNIYHRPKCRPRRMQMRYRYVFRYEMEFLLRISGFTVSHVYGGFQRQPYDYHSGVMIFTVRPGLAPLIAGTGES